MKTTFVIVMTLLSFYVSNAQVKHVDWTELNELQSKEAKGVLVYIFEDNCSFCLLMQRNTFTDQKVQEKLDQSFYFLPFDANTTEDIVLWGRVYKGRKGQISRKYHPLAELLSKGKGLPALIFFNSKMQPIYSYNGYMSPQQFLQNLAVIEQHIKSEF